VSFWEIVLQIAGAQRFSQSSEWERFSPTIIRGKYRPSAFTCDYFGDCVSFPNTSASVSYIYSFWVFFIYL